MAPLRIIKIVLGLTIGAFAVTGADISNTIAQPQAALREMSRDNIAWAASQGLTEFNRLQYEVATFAIPGSIVSQDDVRVRFDIMYNRLNILRNGDLGEFDGNDPEQRSTLNQLQAILDELQPEVDGLDQPGAPERILSHLGTVAGSLTRFVAAASQFSGDKSAEDQQRLLKLHRTFSLLAAGLVICGIAFIGLLFYQNRVVAAAHRKLRHATDDLLIAKEAAEEASNAKSRFLANMSHELRTPLNAIIGFSEIIAYESFGPGAQSRYREYAGDILKSGQHMYNLVNDILTMAKLDTGHYDLTLQSLNLGPLVKSTLAMFMGTEMASKRDVAIEPTSEWWPWLRADERAVRQILLNLLSNAAKFSPADSPIRLSCQRTAEGGAQVTVADRGIGMMPEETERVGAAFYQVDGRLARRYEGSGLGLSIVKGLIERHGGRLIVKSQCGRGSQISITFPSDLLEPVALAAVA